MNYPSLVICGSEIGDKPKRDPDVTGDGLAFKEDMLSECERKYGNPWNTHANPTEKPTESE